MFFTNAMTAMVAWLGSLSFSQLCDMALIFFTTMSPLSTVKNGIKKLVHRVPALKSWQFWATIFTGISLLLAALAFWTSLEASRFAEWTAHKDFALLCIDEATRHLSPECPKEANFSLSAPPGFHSPSARRGSMVHRRSEDDWASPPAVLLAPWPNINLDLFQPETVFMEQPTHPTFTASQCEMHTMFWITIQIAIAVHVLFSGHLCPALPWKSPDAAQISLSRNPSKWKKAAFQRAASMWRARNRQMFFFACLLFLHGRLCTVESDFIKQRLVALIPGSKKDDAGVSLFGSLLLMNLPRLLEVSFLGLVSVFRSGLRAFGVHPRFFLVRHLDVSDLVREAIYLTSVPILSFLLTKPYYEVSWVRCCGSFLFRAASKPSDDRNDLEEYHVDWIKNDDNIQKICKDCQRLDGRVEDHLREWQKGGDKQWPNRPEGCFICHRQTTEGVEDEIEEDEYEDDEYEDDEYEEDEYEDDELEESEFEESESEEEDDEKTVNIFGWSISYTSRYWLDPSVTTGNAYIFDFLSSVII
ncbi:hypothetical protein FDECE_5266 [Fusarium decemcellulare]|nr:hypothetical protein FDECE_5266 [Fusarium decemcellulare]